jgi:hypothetical protein
LARAANAAPPNINAAELDTRRLNQRMKKGDKDSQCLPPALWIVWYRATDLWLFISPVYFQHGRVARRTFPAE